MNEVSDLIVQSHPLEFQNSRQATKIAYLQQEIKYLQDTVKDLEQLTKINKEALKLVSNQSTPEKSQQKCMSQEDATASTFDTRSSPQSTKEFQALNENLQEENSKLLEMIEKLKRERTVAQSKALLSEQICEEVQRHESEVMAELQNQIIELRKMVQEKEYFIQQMEKVKPFPDQDGVVVKYRDVMSASEQNLRLLEEINNYNTMLMKIAKDHNKLQLEKEELVKQNTTLSNELVKLKAIMVNPMNSKFSLKSLIGNNVKNILNRSFHQRHKSPITSPLIIPDDDSNASYTGTKNANACGLATRPSKFKQDQEKIHSKKPSSPYIATNPLFDMKLLDKISQLETEKTRC